jgi:hypothetical protein
MDTPVALVIFNRPEFTKKVFEKIRAQRPKKLFIIADGPRTEAEKKICDETRAIVEEVDWDCDVQKNYAEGNMGCDPRVSSGITWIFEHVDRAIIFEDDCVPHEDFFPFCEELLERYKDNTRIMHISGDNYQGNNPKFRCDASYFFSTIPHIHGWATWKRAWNLYDDHLSQWPKLREEGFLKKIFPDPGIRAHWTYKYDQYYAGKIAAWDGRWAFACVTHHGLSINPRTNLVTNIGYGAAATHSVRENVESANVPTQGLTWPLKHPQNIALDSIAEKYTYKYVFGIDREPHQRMISLFRHHVPFLYSLLKRIKTRL